MVDFPMKHGGSFHSYVKLPEGKRLEKNPSITGWWLLLTPLKNDGVSKSWDDEILNWMEK